MADENKDKEKEAEIGKISEAEETEVEKSEKRLVFNSENSQNEVEDIDERIQESRRERDKARRDVHRAIVAGRSMESRIEMLEKVMLKPMGKNWRHPFHIAAFSKYHRCAACGGEFEDEVVVVVDRTRSGDRNYVFCSKECLTNYEGW